MILEPIQTRDESAHLIGFGHGLQELGDVRSEDHVDLDVEEERWCLLTSTKCRLFVGLNWLFGQWESGL